MARPRKVHSGRQWPRLLAALCLVFASTSAGSAQDCGDLNDDGSVTAADALSALQVATGSAPACDFCVCDPDCNRESTASDALEILRGAIGIAELGCCVIDACFTDEDCAGGQECTSDPAASCDLACVGTTTTTLHPGAVDECFEDEDCPSSGFPEGYVCAGFRCVECDDDAHCEAGFQCVANECVSDSSSFVAPGEAFELDARPLFLPTAADVAPDGRGGFFVVWSDRDREVPGQVRILAQQYDSETADFRQPVDLSGSSDDLLRPVAACVGSDGRLNAVWEEELRSSRLPNGIYRDPANVRLGAAPGGPPSAPVIANEYTDGYQSFPDVACLADGSFVVAWRDVCAAIERRGVVVVHFQPDDCDANHENGVYFRRFAADGTPLGPSEHVETPGQARSPSVEGLPEGGFLLLAPYRMDAHARTRVVRYDTTGTELGSTTIPGAPGYYGKHGLQCADSRCLAVVGDFGEDAVASVIDLSGPTAVRSFVLAAQDPGPADGSSPSYVDDARAACDGAGRCLITWVREDLEIDYDVVLEWRVTPLARTYDLGSQVLGPPMELEPARPADEEGWTPFLASVGPGRYAVLFHGSTDSGMTGRFYELVD